MTIFEPGGALDLEEHQNIIIQRPELDDVLNHIKKKRHYIALRSPRQMGKTTFLYQIQACLHGHDYGVVYVDLSGLGKAMFYQTICAKIRDQLGDLIDGLAEDVLHPHDVTDQDAFSGYLTRLSAFGSRTASTETNYHAGRNWRCS